MLRSTLAFGLVLAACSSDDTTATNTPAPPPDGLVGDIKESLTLEDGQKFAGVVRIFPDVTLTIAPGAKITCTEATQIVVGGTLKVDAKDNHASISCAKWVGVIVAQGGKLDIDGLDISNADVGYKTTAGNGSSVVKNSKIITSVRPFEIGADSKLSLDHIEASVPESVPEFTKSYVEVYGELDAKYLDYEARTNEGIMARNAGKVTITDSKIHSKGGQDMISAYDGASMNVSYTTLDGAHCGIHLQSANDAVIDRITSTGNLFGVTIYSAKTVRVTNSNLSGAVAWLDKVGGEETDQATFENNFLVQRDGKDPNAIYEPGVKTAPLKADTRATAEIPDAKPR